MSFGGGEGKGKEKGRMADQLLSLVSVGHLFLLLPVDRLQGLDQQVDKEKKPE